MSAPRRPRLHRKLFVWLWATIAATAVVAVVVTRLVGSGAAAWQREVERAEALAADRFERVWDDEAARAELEGAIERTLEAEVRLVDGPAEAPAECARPHVALVKRGGRELGRVEICFRRAPRPSAARLLVPLVAAALALWAASRKVARWLARPLGEVADVARELGEGRLTARVALRPRETAELAEVGSAMNELAERIQHQLSAQRELLAAVSHELRTPLARVRLLAGLAEQAASEGERTRHLAALEREVMELDGLVGQLLAQSRLDFSEREARRIDAALLAARALERAGLDPAALEVEGTARHVLGDPTLLASALANLVHNALSHGGGLARLVVWSSDAPRAPEVGAGGPRVVLEVHDDGPGIEPADLERVFEPFRTSGSAAGAGSLGLGLALVDRIARAHGGGAFAANRTPRGSVIGLWLPAARAGETAVVSRRPERG